MRLPPRRVCVPFAQRDELLRHALRLLGLGPRRRDGLVLDQRRDQVAQQRLAMRRLAAEVPVLGRAAGHGSDAATPNLLEKMRKIFNKVLCRCLDSSVERPFLAFPL